MKGDLLAFSREEGIDRRKEYISNEQSDGFSEIKEKVFTLFSILI